MAAKRKKSNLKLREQHESVDVYARILQAVAIIALVCLYLISSLFPPVEIDVWVFWGLLGVAIGLQPEQMGRIISDIFKNIGGRK